MALLASAYVYWKSVDYSGSGAWLDGAGGSGPDAQRGSTSGADANDPKWLEYAGEQYVYAPALSGNYISTPDQAGFSGITVLDFDVAVAMDDWTPGSSVLLAGQDDLSAARVWHLMLQASGALRFSWWNSSGAANNADSLALGGVTDGAKKWVRVVFDTAGSVAFYTSDDGAVWTLNRNNVIAATSLDDEASALMVGGNSSGGFMPEGKFYRARLYSGLRSSGGTLVVDFDASLADPEDTTFVASTGETWTLNRSASGRRLEVVDKDMFLPGTDDYFDFLNNAAPLIPATGDFTLALLVRARGNGANQTIFGQYIAAAGNGRTLVRFTSARVLEWFLGNHTASGAASVTVSGPALVAGADSLVVVRRSGNKFQAWTEGVAGAEVDEGATQRSILQCGNIIGMNSQSATYNGAPLVEFINSPFIAGSIWYEALTDIEGKSATIKTELLTVAA